MTLSVNKVIRQAGRKCYQCKKQMTKDEIFVKIHLVTSTKWGNTLDMGICIDCINKVYEELYILVGESNA